MYVYITLHYSTTLHYITLHYITLQKYIHTYISIHTYIYIFCYNLPEEYAAKTHRALGLGVRVAIASRILAEGRGELQRVAGDPGAP